MCFPHFAAELLVKSALLEADELGDLFGFGDADDLIAVNLEIHASVHR